MEFEVAGQTVTGFQTTFDFGREEVRRGWWKYAKQFGNPLDMRSYYQVRIPAETTDGNLDLTIYSQTLLEESKIVFKLGLEDKKYKPQLEQLLVDFKRDFYIQHYLNEIHLVELSSARLSDEYAASSTSSNKDELLRDLQSKQAEIARLKGEIKVIEADTWPKLK